MKSHSDEFYDGIAYAIGFIEKVGRDLRRENPPGTAYGTATCDGLAAALSDSILRLRGESNV